MIDRTQHINLVAGLALAVSFLLHVAIVPARILCEVDLVTSSSFAEAALLLSVMCYWLGVQKSARPVIRDPRKRNH